MPTSNNLFARNDAEQYILQLAMNFDRQRYASEEAYRLETDNYINGLVNNLYLQGELDQQATDAEIQAASDQQWRAAMDSHFETWQNSVAPPSTPRPQLQRKDQISPVGNTPKQY